jgi:hypothetical protein
VGAEGNLNGFIWAMRLPFLMSMTFTFRSYLLFSFV